MARITVGGTADDFIYVVRPGGAWGTPVVPVVLTWWDAETGGSQLTDLLLGGQPVTQVTVPAGGRIPVHQWPDGVRLAWADAGAGRFLYDHTGDAVEVPPASTTVPGIARRATAAEVDDGTDVVAWVNPARLAARLAAVRTAIKDEILGGAGAAFDTLQELKALIDSGDASLSTTLTDLVGQKLAKAANLSDLSNVSTALDNLGFTSIGKALRAATTKENARRAIGILPPGETPSAGDVNLADDALYFRRPASAPTSRQIVTVETDGSQGSVAASSLTSSYRRAIGAAAPANWLLFPPTITSAATALSSGRGNWAPMAIPKGIYDAFVFNLQAARSGGDPVTLHLAVYAIDPATGLPTGAPIRTASTQALDTVPGASPGPANQVVVPFASSWTNEDFTDYLVFALLVHGTTAPTTAPTLLCFSGGQVWALPWTAHLSGTGRQVYSRTGLTGPPSDTTSSNIGVDSGSRMPIVALRRVSA